MEIGYRAIDKVLDKQGKIDGYVLQDDLGNVTSGTVKAIKYRLINKDINIYNLELTSDHKLVHKSKNDRYGLTVPSELFFTGNYLDWYVACQGNSLILNNNKLKVNFRFDVTLYDNGRAWLVTQLQQDRVLLGESYHIIVYRNKVGSFEDFILSVDRTYKTKKIVRQRETVHSSTTSQTTQKSNMFPSYFIDICKTRADNMEYKRDNLLYIDSTHGELNGLCRAYVRIEKATIACKVQIRGGDITMKHFRSIDWPIVIEYLVDCEVIRPKSN